MSRGPEAERAPQRTSRLGVIARIAIALAGLALLATVVREVGLDHVLPLLSGAAPWLPLALVLELGRIACDAWSTRLVLGERGRSIPTTTLFLAQLAGHGVMNVFPAGRSSSEAVKATLLHPWIGAAPAIAMATANQANTLISSALFSLACLGAALLVSSEAMLGWAIFAHFAVLFVSGVALRVAATDRRVEFFLLRRFPRIAARAVNFHAASRDTPVIAWGPVIAMGAGRAVQTVEYAVLAYAVGVPVGPLGALTVQGVNLVGAAVGVMIPGQLGSSELVFALAAEALGTDAARATSIALLAHALGLVAVGAGLVILLAWRARPSVSPPRAPSPSPDA